MKTENKSRFYDEMKESLMRLKPEEMEITFKRIDKQNRKRLHGCTLQMPGAVAAPTFYLEDLYEAYLNGTAAEDIAQSLINYAKENNLDTLPGGIDIEDYSSVRKNLGLIVIGEEKNKDYLKEMIYRKIEDLALIPIIFTNDERGTGCIKIREEFLEMWGVTADEVMEEAFENAPRIMPPTFRQLSDIICTVQDERGDDELFVISNRYYAGGAAVAFYPGFLDCIGTALNKDLFILPSSVNELILVTDSGQDPEKEVFISFSRCRHENERLKGFTIKSVWFKIFCRLIKSMMRRVGQERMPERNTAVSPRGCRRAASVLIRNCLKTSSERPQSGPATPLASNEVVLWPEALF